MFKTGFDYLYGVGTKVVSSVASGTSALASGATTAISNTATQTTKIVTTKLKNTASAATAMSRTVWHTPESSFIKAKEALKALLDLLFAPIPDSDPENDSCDESFHESDSDPEIHDISGKDFHYQGLNNALVAAIQAYANLMKDIEQKSYSLSDQEQKDLPALKRILDVMKIDANNKISYRGGVYSLPEFKDQFGTEFKKHVRKALKFIENWEKPRGPGAVAKKVTSYQPNYTPSDEIVNASAALDKLLKIHNSSSKKNEAEARKDASEELKRLLAWLSKNKQKDPFTDSFHLEIDELAEELGKESKAPNSGKQGRILIKGNQIDVWTRVEDVYKQLNYWAQPSKFSKALGGDASPSLDSAVMKPLMTAFNHCILFRQSFVDPDNARAIEALKQFEGALELLFEGMKSGSIPVDFNQTTLQQDLKQEFDRLKEVTKKAKWHEETPPREKAFQIVNRLFGIFDHVIQPRLPKIDEKKDPKEPSESFFTTLARLQRLESAMETGDSQEVTQLSQTGLGAYVRFVTALKANGPEMLKAGYNIYSLSSKNTEATKSFCMPEEFKALLEKLNVLHQNINKEGKNNAEILDAARSTFAILTAILKQNADNIDCNGIAKHYSLPLEVILGFSYFSQLLERTIRNHELGYCDPNNKNHYVFTTFELQKGHIPVPTSIEQARIRIHNFLKQWQNKEVQGKSKEDSWTQLSINKLVGEAPKKPDIPNPSPELLKRADEIFDNTLEDVSDIQDHYEETIEPQLNKLPRETRRKVRSAMAKLASGSAGAVAPKGQDLARALHEKQNQESAPEEAKLQPPNVEDIDEARKALSEARSQLREQENKDKKAKATEENNNRSLNTAGLIGALGNAAMGVAGSVGLTQPSIKTVVEGGVRLANQFAHGVKADDGEEVEKTSIGETGKGIIQTGKGMLRAGAGVFGIDDSTTKGIEDLVDTGLAAIGLGDGKDEEEGGDKVGKKKKKADDSTSLFRLHADAEDAATFNTTVSGISVSDKKISEEKDLFISNNTGNITMKILYEYVCGMKMPNVDFYGEMIEKARAAGPTKEYDVLKEAFLNELDKAGVGSVLATIVGWILFPVLYGISHHYLKLFANNGVEWIKEFIENNNKDALNSTFANNVADRTNGFLATLQSAYRRIADNPNISGDLSAELEKELSKPEFNFGMTPKQLHQAVADQLISAFIEPGVLQVSQGLRESCSNWHPFKGSIADVVLNTTAVIASWIATIGIYPIEWILRKLFLNLLVSRYVVNGALVESLVTSSVGSIQQNGYTHALNCVLYDQLKYVYVTLQRHYNGGAKDEEEESVDLNKFSVVDRGKLRTLVQELFSVLEKHQCNSPEELRRFINDDSTLKKLKADFEDQFVYSKIVKSLEEVIGAALHTFLKKDQLEKQFYQLLTTVNGIFKKGEEIPPSEYQRKEDDINRIIDSLLLLVIDNSLNELADFDREHEQLGVDAQVKELTNLAKGLYKGLNASYRKLRRTVEDVESGVPYTTKNEDLLHDMTTKSSHFLSKIIEWRTRVQSPENGLSKEAKAALIELEANLRDQIESMILSLSAIYGPRAKMSLADKIAEILERFKNLLESIVHYITGDEEGPVNRKLEALKEHLQKLQKEPALQSQTSIIREKIEEIEKLVEEKKKMNPLQKALDEDLNPENNNSAIRIWLKNKQQEDFAKVKQALERISKSTTEHQALTKLIGQIKKGNSTLNDYKDEWKAFRKELSEKQEKISEAAEKLQERCNRAADKCSFSDEESVDAAWMLVDLGMKQLKDWLDSPSSVKLAKDNSFLRPLKEKAIEFGKNYVTDRVRNKSTGVLSLIRDTVIWHHGLYNHNILYPFIGKS